MFKVTVNREEFSVEPQETGVRVVDSRGVLKLIPWESVVCAPTAWGVIADGWLESKHPTERDALEAADVHRAYGTPATVVRIH